MNKKRKSDESDEEPETSDSESSNSEVLTPEKSNHNRDDDGEPVEERLGRGARTRAKVGVEPMTRQLPFDDKPGKNQTTVKVKCEKEEDWV